MRAPPPSSSAQPITVGISLPLTGQFAADGLATLNGYKLWASDVNTNGGLLHRPVKLVIRNDNSNEKTVTSDYSVLIHAGPREPDAGPVLDAAERQRRRGHREIRVCAVGWRGHGPGRVQPPASQPLQRQPPVKLEMVPFANWVEGLPASQRQTAAYPEVNNPFADPPVTATEATCRGTVSRRVYPANQLHAAVSNKQIKQAAQAVANKNPQIVVIGSVDLPSLLIFIHTFAGHELHAQDHDRRVRAGPGPGVPEQAEPLQRPGRSWCRTAGSAVCRTR